MSSKDREIDDELQALVDLCDRGLLPTDEAWQQLDEEGRDDSLLMQDVVEALHREAEPVDAGDAATDAAWQHFAARQHIGKPRLRWWRTAGIAALGMAAALLIAFLLVRPGDDTAKREVATTAHKAAPRPAAVEAPAPKAEEKATARLATVMRTATTRQAGSTVGQLIMDLQEQGYAVDGQVQRSSLPIPPGKLGKVVLPDGTEVFLYASSKLTYPSAFVGDEREVVLEGQAYFKVTHDSSHPFIIHTGNVSTRVLGTELCVSAYVGEPLHVSLITGVAEVVAAGDVCRLQPSEGVSLLDGSLVKKAENMDNYAYALKGYLYADDEPLENVMRRLGHWYGMKVVFADRRSLHRGIHIVCKGDEPPARVAELLSGMGAFTVSVEGDTFYVR